MKGMRLFYRGAAWKAKCMTRLVKVGACFHRAGGRGEGNQQKE